MGDRYQFLLGADILRGAQGMLEEVQVVAGSRVEWYDRRRDARFITRVVNPVGPVGAPGIGATAPTPSGSGQAVGAGRAGESAQGGGARRPARPGALSQGVQEMLPPPPAKGGGPGG